MGKIEQINTQFLPENLKNLTQDLDYTGNKLFRLEDLEGHLAAVQKKNEPVKKPNRPNVWDQPMGGLTSDGLNWNLPVASRPAFRPENTDQLCTKYNELKKALGMKTAQACERFSDFDQVLAKLSKKLLPKREPEVRLQAIVYGERQLLTVIENRAHNNSRAYKVEQQKLNETRTRYILTGNVQIHNYETGKDSQEAVWISFKTVALDESDRAIEDLQITIADRKLSSREIALYLPDIIGHLGPVAHRICKATLASQSILSFDHSSADLNERAKVYLDTVAEILRKYPSLLLTITGSGDTTGGEAANRAIGQSRAQNVKNYLVLKTGGEWRGNIRVKTSGESELLAKTGDNVKNPYNRNIQIEAYSREALTVPTRSGGLSFVPAWTKEQYKIDKIEKPQIPTVTVDGFGEVYPVYIMGDHLESTSCEGRINLEDAYKVN